MGHTCITLGGMYGSLLVASEHVCQAVGVVIKAVEYGNYVSSGVAENAIYVFGYQSADQSFSSGDFIRHFVNRWVGV